MLNLCLGIFTLMMLFHLYRIIKGPSIWERMLGFNLFSNTMIVIIIVFALANQLYYYLDIAIVYALLGFIGTVFIARFIQRKGNI